MGNNMTIAEKLRKLRKLRKLTTSELANISGVHQTTISAIENKRHMSPGIETIERLAEALRVSPLYFFDQKIKTPFDIVEDLPSEIAEFLLREESLPYLRLSQKAYENGITSNALERILGVFYEHYENAVPEEEKIIAGSTKKKQTAKKAS